LAMGRGRSLSEINIYAYLDEAGSLPDGPGHFVIAILLTTRPRSLQKVIRKARQKMKRAAQKRRRRIQELKFHNASDPTRRRVLESLRDKEAEIFLLALELENSVPDTPENYARAVWAILQDCLERYPALSLTVDLHFNVAERRTAFDRWIEERAKRPVTITHKDSQRDNLLQLVDFVAGATYQKYARGNQAYWEIFARRVVVERAIKWPPKNDGRDPGGRFT